MEKVKVKDIEKIRAEIVEIFIFDETSCQPEVRKLYSNITDSLIALMNYIKNNENKK